MTITYKFPCLTCVGKHQLYHWIPFSWYWKGWWLRIAHESSLIMIPGKNRCPPQLPRLILHYLYIGGFFFLGPYVLGLLQCWGEEDLTIVYCWGLDMWGSFHSLSPSGNFLVSVRNSIHEDIELVLYLSCTLLWFPYRDASLVLRWVCPIGHMSSSCAPLK